VVVSATTVSERTQPGSAGSSEAHSEGQYRLWAADLWRDGTATPVPGGADQHGILHFESTDRGQLLRWPIPAGTLARGIATEIASPPSASATRISKPPRPKPKSGGGDGNSGATDRVDGEPCLIGFPRRLAHRRLFLGLRQARIRQGVPVLGSEEKQIHVGVLNRSRHVP
jgi:hypothetical protein